MEKFMQPGKPDAPGARRIIEDAGIPVVPQMLRDAGCGVTADGGKARQNGAGRLMEKN